MQFPTIKMYPAGSKDTPKTYSGSHSLEDLAQFVANSGTWKINALSAGSEHGTVQGGKGQKPLPVTEEGDDMREVDAPVSRVQHVEL